MQEADLVAEEGRAKLEGMSAAQRAEAEPLPIQEAISAVSRAREEAKEETERIPASSNPKVVPEKEDEEAGALDEEPEAKTVVLVAPAEEQRRRSPLPRQSPRRLTKKQR